MDNFKHKNEIIMNPTFLYWKPVFLISAFNYLHRGAIFIEMCNIYANQMVIKVAVSIVNSHKLSRS